MLLTVHGFWVLVSSGAEVYQARMWCAREETLPSISGALKSHKVKGPQGRETPGIKECGAPLLFALQIASSVS